MDARLGIGAAIIAAIGYGGVGIMLTYATKAGLEGSAILAWRFTMTSALLWLFFGAKGFQNIAKAKSTALKGLLLGAILYASQCYTYFAAVSELGAGKTAVILYTYPAMVIVYNWLTRISKPRWGSFLLLVLATLGTGLTVYQPGGGSSVVGLALALSTALIYTAYLLASHKVTHRLNAETSAMVVSSGAALSFWGACLLGQKTLQPNEAIGWIPLVTMAIFCTLIPLIAAFMAVKSLGPARTSVICMLEPIVATWLGVFLLGEVVTYVQVAGSFMVILASYFLQKTVTERPNPELSPNFKKLPTPS